jgi:hypothetical protein
VCLSDPLSQKNCAQEDGKIITSVKRLRTPSDCVQIMTTGQHSDTSRATVRAVLYGTSSYANIFVRNIVHVVDIFQCLLSV